MIRKKNSGLNSLVVNTENVKRQIQRKCQKYYPDSRMCDVCLSEKLAIMENKEHNSLNQRTELMNRCIHQSLKTLSSAKRK